MIAILGASGSGKTTLQEDLIRYCKDYKRLITYTTRPPRKGEEKEKSYHFISPGEFEILIKSDFFAERAEYNGWQYGIAKRDCLENSVAAITPSGLRTLKRNGISVFSIYLYVDRRSRLIQLLQRGDNIEEAYRRNLTDEAQFDGVSEEVDCVIYNEGYQFNRQQILLKVVDALMEKRDEIQ